MPNIAEIRERREKIYSAWEPIACFRNMLLPDFDFLLNEVERLEKDKRRMEFMIERGLDWEDMNNLSENERPPEEL